MNCTVDVRPADDDARLRALLSAAAAATDNDAVAGCALYGAYIAKEHLPPMRAARLSVDDVNAVVAVLALRREAAVWRVELVLSLGYVANARALLISHVRTLAEAAGVPLEVHDG
jgi:hypothetical protein